MEADGKCKDQFLDDFVANRRHYEKPLPGYIFDLGMPLLLNSSESPLSCRETAEELENASRGFTDQICSLFDALKAARDPNTNLVTEQKPILRDTGPGLVIAIGIQLQSFDRYPSCLHRTYYSRRLFLTDPAALPRFATSLKMMTSLEEAELRTYLVWHPSEERRSNYGEAQPYDDGLHIWGVKCNSTKNGSQALVEWQVGEWRPNGDIISLFESLGGDGGVQITSKLFEFVEEREQTDNEAYRLADPDYNV